MKLKLLDTGMSKIGWHRHGTMLTCPMKWSHQFLLKTPGTYSAGRSLGTALHLALAHHYLKISDPVQFERLELVEPAHAISQYLGVDSGQLPHALVLWRLYLESYPPAVDLKFYKVIAVEEEIGAELDGKPYAQRADLVVRRLEDQKVYIWDHKTMGGFGQGPGYAEAQFTMSGQILGLTWIGQQLYRREFGGVILNCIRTAPAEQTKRFFRVAPPAAPDAVLRFPELIIRARDLTREFAEKLPVTSPHDYPRVADPTVCHAYGGCDYLQMCRFGS